MENENEKEPRVGLKLNSVSTCISKEREIHCNRGKWTVRFQWAVWCLLIMKENLLCPRISKSLPLDKRLNQPSFLPLFSFNIENLFSEYKRRLLYKTDYYARKIMYLTRIAEKLELEPCNSNVKVKLCFLSCMILLSGFQIWKHYFGKVGKSDAQDYRCWYVS